MSDLVLNNFIDKLLNENIEEDKFEQYIDMFSKFLAYVNSDYKYNGTYLNQYIDDFKIVYKMLKKKKKIHGEIFCGLIRITQNFELTTDRTFFTKFLLEDSVPKGRSEYIGIDKNKIISNYIEVKITIMSKNDEYVFCKQYNIFEIELLEKLCNDVKEIISMKKLGGKNSAS